MLSISILTKKTCIKSYRKLSSEVLKTALYDYHVNSGGKMVEFAGYQLPVQVSNFYYSTIIHIKLLLHILS